MFRQRLFYLPNVKENIGVEMRLHINYSIILMTERLCLSSALVNVRYNPGVFPICFGGVCLMAGSTGLYAT